MSDPLPRFYPLLRFHGASLRDARVDAWLKSRPDGLREPALRWFARLRGCGPDVRELMHDGHATACVEDAPFASVGVFKAHVNLCFFHGHALPDPEGLLEGAGKYMRHVKLRPGEGPGGGKSEEALLALIAAAFSDIGIRLRQAS